MAENPLLLGIPPAVARVMICCLIFTILLSLASVAVHFLYRYNVMCRGVKWANQKYALVFGVFVAWIGVHGVLLYVAMTDTAPGAVGRLARVPDFHERTPPYVFVDTVCFTLGQGKL